MGEIGWGQLSLGAVAILATAYALITVVKQKNGKSGDLSEKSTKVIENNTKVIENNTKALEVNTEILQKVLEKSIAIDTKTDVIMRNVGGGR